MTVRIVMVDDHEVVRAGMRLMLEDDGNIEIVGECDNGQDAIKMAAELKPDVVVMDITMPEMNGIEATRRIKQASPEVAVLALTIHEGCCGQAHRGMCPNAPRQKTCCGRFR